MALVVLLIIAAIVLGALGLIVSALKWLLIVAVVLLVAGAVAGWLRRAT